MKKAPLRVRLRALQPRDVAACAALVATQPLWKRYGYGARRCARDLRAARARGDRVSVAVVDGRVAGVAWVTLEGGFNRAPYLKLLAVDLAAQGAGIGAALLEAAEAGGGLLLLVSDFNRGARRFYARHGFKRVGALPGFVLPGVTEIALWRPATRRRRPAPLQKSPKARRGSARI